MGKADDSNEIVPVVAPMWRAVARTGTKVNVRIILPRATATDPDGSSTSLDEFLGVDDDFSIPRVTICELHAII